MLFIGNNNDTSNAGSFLEERVSLIFTEFLTKPRLCTLWGEAFSLQLEMCTILGQCQGGKQSHFISLRVFVTQRFHLYQKSIFKNKFLISV